MASFAFHHAYVAAPVVCLRFLFGKRATILIPLIRARVLSFHDTAALVSEVASPSCHATSWHATERRDGSGVP